METEYGKEFQAELSLICLKNIFKRYSLYTFLGSVFAEIFNHTLREFLKRPVFLKGVGKIIAVFLIIAKRFNNRKHSSTKQSPLQASLKKNEGFDYQSVLDKRKKMKPKFV